MKNAKLMADGYLLVGQISVQDCVTYQHDEREEKAVGEGVKAEWHTRKNIANKQESERLRTTRNQARWTLLRIGALSIGGMGYFVPAARREALEQAVKEAEQMVVDFNASARVCRMSFDFVTFEISGSDVRMARVMMERTANYMDLLARSIERGDISRLRTVLAELGRVDEVLGGEFPAQFEELSLALRNQCKVVKKAVKDAAAANSVKGNDYDALAAKLLKDCKADGPVLAMRASLVEKVGELNKQMSKLPVIAARAVEAGEKPVKAAAKKVVVKKSIEKK